VNSPSQDVVVVDAIDGKLLCISRFDQNTMGNFNSPSHVVGPTTQQCAMGNANSCPSHVVGSAD
jgi:hypothetical protein